MTIVSRAFTALSLCGLLSATSIAQAPPVFHPGEQFAAGDGPQSVAIGDVDGNGIADLVTANGDSNTVSVLLGMGTGSFEAPTTFGAGINPQSVAIGELNGDGNPDLVTVNPYSNDVSVLLGTGTGSFGAPTAAGVGINPQSFALGDLNGDSISDLVTLLQGPEMFWGIGVLLGTGTGGFGAPTAYSVGIGPGLGLLPASITIGDLNGDSKLDVVTVNVNPASMSVLIGSGTGDLGLVTAFAVGAGTPAIGDVNEDGLGDLVAPSSGSISVLLGTGMGYFGAPTPVSGGEGPIALGDLNGDGHLDLMLESSGSDTVTVLPGTGAGSFGAPTTLGDGLTAHSVEFGDVNGDSKPDFVTANADTQDVSVRLNAGAGTAGIPWTYLGHGLAGTGGQTPRLLGNGPLTVNSSNQFCLDHAKSGSAAYFCFGFAAEFNAFFGGVLVPAPLHIYGPYAVDAQGTLCLPALKWLWTPGLKFYLQAWIRDAAAPKGFSASNGLQGAGQ
jgi:hypothetical protein